METGGPFIDRVLRIDQIGRARKIPVRVKKTQEWGRITWRSDHPAMQLRMQAKIELCAFSKTSVEHYGAFQVRFANDHDCRNMCETLTYG